VTLPPILYIDDLQKLMPHRDGEWIRRFLKANGVSHKTPSGSIYTTDVALEGAFPDAYPALVRRWADVQAGRTGRDPNDFSDLDADDDTSE
jgi:hypothetical protein